MFVFVVPTLLKTQCAAQVITHSARLASNVDDISLRNTCHCVIPNNELCVEDER